MLAPAMLAPQLRIACLLFACVAACCNRRERIPAAASADGAAGTRPGGSAGAAGASSGAAGDAGPTHAPASNASDASAAPARATCNPAQPSGKEVSPACTAEPSAQGLCTLVDADGRSWSYPPGCSDRRTARAFCAQLALDGHSDWRLANIDDLRSVVKACAMTATGGPCKVTAQCTSLSACWKDIECAICASAGTTACETPQAAWGAMLSDSATPDGARVWTLDCSFGARILALPADTRAPFQCVR